MTAGMLIVIVYWVIFTIRKGFTPKLTRAERVNAYDINRTEDGTAERKTAERKRKSLAAGKWALRIAGWVENVLLFLMLAWVVFLIGALLTGTVIAFGYPV